MSRPHVHILFITAAALAAAATPAAARAELDRCYADWTEAAPLVARERLVAVADLSRLARERLASELVKTTLCAEQGRFVYRLVVREPAGGLRNFTVDARDPFRR